MFKRFKVVVLENGNYRSQYDGISNIYPSFDGKHLYLVKELTEEEIHLYKNHKDFFGDKLVCTIDNADNVTLITTLE